MEIEIWKDIPGYNGLYQASNLGNIKSKGCFKKTKYGGSGAYRDTILRPGKNKQGYLSVFLRGETPHKSMRVHRLVAITFLPNPENKRDVNHINGIKSDNNLNNLEWNTHHENCLHGWKIGLYKKRFGEQSSNVKLTQNQVLEILKLCKENPKVNKCAIAREYNVESTAIYNIAKGTRWSDIKAEMERLPT